MESTDTTCGRGSSNKKFRMLAIGMLGATALSLPAVTAVTAVTTVATHGAWGHTIVRPYSHRLAVGVMNPQSLRLV